MFVASHTTPGLPLSNQQVNGDIPVKPNLLVRCCYARGEDKRNPPRMTQHGSYYWAGSPRAFLSLSALGLKSDWNVTCPRQGQGQHLLLILQNAGYVPIAGCRLCLPLSDTAGAQCCATVLESE